MKSRLYILLIFLVLLNAEHLIAQDTLVFKGQLSGWVNINPDIDLPVYAGLRYIPTLNYQSGEEHKKLIDFEVSADVNLSAGFHPFDTGTANGNLKPYRLWARYSTRHAEVRLGLQKINFGSASILRPLMWFDQLDPRDPLQLTQGVWGILGRYYFLNNANIWIWGLYGNQGPKTWEIGKTHSQFPEMGGRFQMPVPKGEFALSYHFRKADTRGLGSDIPSYPEVGENRIGVDGKWDLGIGLWVEGTWTGKNRNTGRVTNQEILNLGVDYTFGLGNGLNIILEHLVISYDEKAFQFSNVYSFTGSSLSYPIGMFDQVNVILFYDWGSNNLYNFINWKRQFNKFSVFLMAYYNPENYRMPQQADSGELFSGKGIQIMLVFNH